MPGVSCTLLVVAATTRATRMPSTKGLHLHLSRDQRHLLGVDLSYQLRRYGKLALSRRLLPAGMWFDEQMLDAWREEQQRHE